MTIGRARKIDIYFVLYLAALLFLLPDSKKDKNETNNEFQPTVLEQSFSLYLEKTSLLCTVSIDSNGINILSFDSVNTIFYTGNVRNIRMEFTVQDQKIGLTSVIDNGNYTGRFFKVIESKAENAAYFYWQPTFDEFSNKSYIVDVTAYAIDNQFNNEVKSRTKFSLNILFVRDIISSQGVLAENIIDSTSDAIGLTQFSESSIRPVELLAYSNIIESIAYENWSKQIFINGTLSRDVNRILPLKIIRTPENNGGTAEIIDLKSSAIVIGGRTPFSGNMKVELAMFRKYDGQKISAEFNVVAKPIKQPDFPSEMFPEMSYVIKPNLPLLSGLSTSAIIRDGMSERIVSDGFSDIVIKPDASDTGKIIVLERYINNNLRDKFNIIIKSIPEPKIIRIGSDGPNKVKLETRSFGLYKGKENLVQLLEIEGNAKYFQKFGALSSPSSEFEHSQFFEIVPKNPKEKFEFKVRCTDNYGKKSNYEVFSEGK